jgi:hypothetical protein
MNAKVKILESLLGRVQLNAHASHRAAVPAPVPNVPVLSGPALAEQRPALSSASSARSSLELDEPGAALGSVAPESFNDFSTKPESLSPPVGPFGGLPLPREPFSLDSEPPASAFPVEAKPTLEQLGQTVSLEEGPRVQLEVDRIQALARAAADVAPSSARALEAAIPSRPSATAFDLPAPPEAREELERYRLGQTQQVVVDAYARPTISTNVVDFVTAQREFQPTTFAELLESSLKL